MGSKASSPPPSFPPLSPPLYHPPTINPPPSISPHLSLSASEGPPAGAAASAVFGNAVCDDKVDKVDVIINPVLNPNALRVDKLVVDKLVADKWDKEHEEREEREERKVVDEAVDEAFDEVDEDFNDFKLFWGNKLYDRMEEIDIEATRMVRMCMML